jgi:hypothetical protein
VNIKFVPDEANAILGILDKKAHAIPIAEADWQVLFSSEGYIRLKQREGSIGKAFDDRDFIVFVQSDELLARRATLTETLSAWLQIDLNNAVMRASAYLPANTPLRANIYPVIKPKINSFVFEVESNPAIFLYLDPQINPAQLENILAHELHHIGSGAVQTVKMQSDEWKTLPEATCRMLQWVGAFGEGIAMLAAAGGADIHPHATSRPEDRACWDGDVENFAMDFRQVETFLLDILSGKLEGQAILDAGFRFFGIQGPWYTVGWKMAVIIERELGRSAVIEAFCDPRKLLAIYNRAAGVNDPRWQDELLLVTA